MQPPSQEPEHPPEQSPEHEFIQLLLQSFDLIVVAFKILGIIAIENNGNNLYADLITKSLLDNLFFIYFKIKLFT